MMLAEYFSFLPFGKYAFYVFSAYGVTFLTFAVLFIHSRINHKNRLISLARKYDRV